MKKVLITGTKSFIGLNMIRLLEQYPSKYAIDFVSLRDNRWRNMDFSEYDSVFHVVGLAHQKETRENADQYYKVNRDLAFEFAKKVKNDHVKHFIFLSSMSVYGVDSGVIDRNTKLNPKTNYGKSKLQAEKLILSLSDEEFLISIVRPPMIYGHGCKGNYPKLKSLALKTPFFPEIRNVRSMIHIDNFCEFIKILIDEPSKGTFFPQNEEYITTSELVKLIAEFNGKKIHFTKILNPIIKLSKSSTTINKVFGDLVYDQSLSKHTKPYCKYNFTESILRTEV